VAFYMSVAPFCLWDPHFVYYSPPPPFGAKKSWTTAHMVPSLPLHSQCPLTAWACVHCRWWKGTVELCESAILVPRQFAEHALRDMLHIFTHATEGDGIRHRNKGHPEVFLVHALNAQTARAPGGGGSQATLLNDSLVNYDLQQRTSLRLRRVPVRFAALPAVVVRNSSDSRLASQAQCANWGSITWALPHLDADCTQYLYERKQIAARDEAHATRPTTPRRTVVVGGAWCAWVGKVT
jgi:hypothetical protein